MSGVLDNAGGDDGGLGALTVLLSGAADSFQTVHVTCRVYEAQIRGLLAEWPRMPATVTAWSTMLSSDPDIGFLSQPAPAVNYWPKTGATD